MPPIPERLTAALSDRYRLERELGAGGMATVYLAEDLKHHRKVAVKVLRPDLAVTLGAERFFREIAIAARLSHPHILGLHDSGEADGFLYYVMPYVEGISLRQKLVREGELPIPEAVRILRDVTDALTYAHGQGVVHRDIKPENVMLMGRHALVMDFGVAKAVGEARGGDASSLTSAGVALGTPAYMAPEQAAGEAHVDHRADLYAWGIVAYELLAGQPPFVRATPQATLAAQLTATPDPVTRHRANVPGALTRLVMQCLEKKPADRPQSAEEVLRTLEQVLTPSGGMTPTDTRPYQTAGMRRAKRRQLLTGGAVAAGLAVSALLGWRWWQGRAEPIVADRVLVAPLEATGEQFRTSAALWSALPAAIVREGVGTPVAAAQVRDLAPGEGATADVSERLARETGAGLVLRASCSGQAPDAACQLELFRRPGSVLRIAAAVRGDPAAPDFSHRLEEQALVLLLLQHRWGDRYLWAGEYVPASLAAVRADHQAADAWLAGDDDASKAAGLRAASLDTNWTSVQLYMATALPAFRRDSAMEALLARPRLPERQRIRVEATRAMVRGEWERAWELLRGYYRRSDEGALIDFVHAAWHSNRFSDVLAAATLADSLPRLGRRRFAVDRVVGMALHQLSRFNDAVVLADSLRARYPELRNPASSQEIMARAGLGDTTGVRALVARSSGGIEEAGAGPRAWMAGQELMAHGNAAAGRALLDTALAWYRHARGTRGEWEWIENELLTLEWLGRLGEAARLADTLERRGRDPKLATCFLSALRGRLAARADRHPEARAVLTLLQGEVDRLLNWPVRGAAVDSARDEAGGCEYEAAAVAAQLGDRDEAVRLLRQARRPPGIGHGAESLILHREPHFAALRGYPPFEELLRPRD